jgi:hypothetical protein
MAGRVGPPRSRRPRRSDVAATMAVVVLVASIVVMGAGFFIVHDLRPTDGPFGLPGRLAFPLCGRSYLLSNLPEQTLQGPAAPAARGAFVVEPTIGKVPLFSLLTCPKGPDGFYFTVIWLHVGPDTYASYALEGGP